LTLRAAIFRKLARDTLEPGWLIADPDCPTIAPSTRADAWRRDLTQQA
jgi:hypothetical protein